MGVTEDVYKQKRLEGTLEMLCWIRNGSNGMNSLLYNIYKIVLGMYICVYKYMCCIHIYLGMYICVYKYMCCIHIYKYMYICVVYV